MKKSAQVPPFRVSAQTARATLGIHTKILRIVPRHPEMTRSLPLPHRTPAGRMVMQKTVSVAHQATAGKVVELHLGTAIIMA